MAVRPYLRSGGNIIARRANELWYRRRLRLIAVDMQEEVRSRVRPWVESLSTSQEAILPTERAMVLRELSAHLHQARSHFRMPFEPQRTAEIAARKILRATDEWWARMTRGWFEVSSASLPQPRFRDAAPVSTPPPRARRYPWGVNPLATLSIIRGQEEIEAAFQAAVRANVELITSVPDDFFDHMEELLFEHVATAERWESLAVKIREGIAQANNFSDYRVELIARDQSSKMASAFNRARSQAVGIDAYIWQTAGDERVRETHAANDGQIFTFEEGAPIDDGAMGNPGDDINCRCVALPYVELENGEGEAA
jgi:SPP1 gp7 family putative phage head morphogenesis protein